eukprot:GHVU01128594.1.p1 GENE.GHVU01128594.1~~GHVU01128594.1.p1  ORF type:complete len:507 (+),score=68.19 GHVU01128594.1:145-1665(+)
MSIFSELVPLGNLNSRNCFTWQLVILLMRRGRCGCRKTTTASSTSRHWRDALHPDRGGFVGGEGPHTTANWREYHGVVSQSEKMVLAGHGGGVRRECPRHPLIGFLVVIPKNVQATIDDSEFVLMRIRVHSPSESSVKIDIEANVTRPLAKAARISGFTTQGVYIESPGFSSANDEDEDSLRRPPDGSRLLVEDVHSDWKAGGSSADADASTATTGGLFVGTQQLRHGWGGGRRRIRTSRPVSRIYGVGSRQMGTSAPPPDNLIGYMQFPELSFESTNTQSMVFSTELNITDLETFNAFTSHLVAKGGALWKLHGITSVHAMGLTFRDIEFSKVLPIEGLKPAPNEDGSAGNNVEMLGMDLSHSTPSEARVAVELDFKNPGLVAVDPVGVLSFGLYHRGLLLGEVSSTNQISLNQGSNVIVLEGVLDPYRYVLRAAGAGSSSASSSTTHTTKTIEDVERQQKIEDMEAFLSRMVAGAITGTGGEEGGPPVITARGRNCSIPLFAGQ